MSTSKTFTDTVTLKPSTAEHFDLAWEAVTQPCPWPKAYGGDMVAQATAAAMLSFDTDAPPKSLHSMHSYFMRPVEIGMPVRYEVEILRDGRGYSTRQIRAYQRGKVAYVCLASFAADAPGATFLDTAPAGLPGPDDLPSSEQFLAARGVDANSTMTEASKHYWQSGRSFDMRHVPGPVYLEIDGEATPHQAVWVRAFDALRTVDGLSDAQRDTAALAYVCDYTILEPVLRVVGLPWAEPGLVTASLDHAMWFHRPIPSEAMNGWLLYAQQAITAGEGRGVGLGRFFTPSGTHLATVVQEGMIRHDVGEAR